MLTLSRYLIKGCCHRLLKDCVLVKWNNMSDQEFSVKQDRKCTYKVILRRVRVTIVVVEKQIVFYMLRLCACMLALVIWNANRIFSAQYFKVICGLSDCTTF